MHGPYNRTKNTNMNENENWLRLMLCLLGIVELASSQSGFQFPIHPIGRGVAFAPRYSSQLVASYEQGAFRKALLGLQNPRFFGGDILFKTTTTPTNGRPGVGGRFVKFQRSALVGAINLWPNGVIYYEMDESVAHLAELIWQVMQQFHEKTCIKFISRENNEPDYIRIEAMKGCFSYIGRVGGEQSLSLGDGCEYRGTIAHELLHAVGFFHHQNRSDRDDYLDIVWENIARGKENQFLKMAPQENILLNQFDYDSVMLYGPRTFGKTLDKITIKPKQDGIVLLEVIEKQGLSLLDVDGINKLYNCQPVPVRSTY